MARFIVWSLAAWLAVCSACGDSEGTGTVRLTTWGEPYIEEGLGKELFSADHWAVRYTKFLFVLSSFQVADDAGQVGAALAKPLVFDMAKKGVKNVATWALDAKPWTEVSYQIGPISADAAPGEFATVEDVALLQRDGASIHVEGIATGPNGEQLTFAWSFAAVTRYVHCRGEQAGKEVDGVLVTLGGTENVQLTIHGDHFFYDDLQSPQAIMRFQALADADADRDGHVTLQELDKVYLFTIPRAMGPYGTGALGDVDTLGDFQRTLARTIGHYRGEGSCDSEIVVAR